VANNGTSVSPLPPFLELIKKRAAPYPHAITTSDIYNSYSPFISSMVESGLKREGQNVVKILFHKICLSSQTQKFEP
jgi:hypothetical protein